MPFLSKISWISVGASLFLAPLLPGIINRTKAIFAGRKGSPILQLYWDLGKLFRKGVVYSATSTIVLRIAPVIICTCMIIALLLLPMGGIPSVFFFQGDIILLFYLLGFVRVMMVLAALDTGSSFEGMGASREVQFSVLAEPTFFMSFVSLAILFQGISFVDIFSLTDHLAAHVTRISLADPLLGKVTLWPVDAFGPFTRFLIILLIVVFFILFLAENARIPFDDPNTHLELTMIHEVMILDYSGPDLGLLLYASSLKLWILGSFIVNLTLSLLNIPGWYNFVGFWAGMLLLGIAVGIIESIMARLSLLRVPRLLVGALVLSILTFLLITGSKLI